MSGPPPVGFQGLSDTGQGHGLYPNIDGQGDARPQSIGFEELGAPSRPAPAGRPQLSYRAAVDTNENTSLVNGKRSSNPGSSRDVQLEMSDSGAWSEFLAANFFPNTPVMDYDSEPRYRNIKVAPVPVQAKHMQIRCSGSDQIVPDRNTQHFRDGKRKIDYILAYTDLDDAEKIAKREAFHRNLIDEGLDLEEEDRKYSQDTQTYFVKIHAPWKLCIRYAELMKMKMPIQTNDIDEPITNQCCKPCGPFKPGIDDEEDFFTAPFYRDGNTLKSTFGLRFLGYEGPDTPNLDFFNNAQRGRIVNEILVRTRYGEEREKFGIRRLWKQGIYTAYFPLHDGSYKLTESGPGSKDNMRMELYYHWARPAAYMKEQPFDAVRNYFGEKVAIYFSWLGFYTWMLVPASIVGIVVFLYGLCTMGIDPTSNEICDSEDKFTMCPLCDDQCGYWYLNSSCTYSKVTYVVDNPATIFYTVFMALWATFFIEFWKRHQARLQYDWDVSDYEEIEQNMRPEYEASVTSKRKNPITQHFEPHMKSLEKCIRVGGAFVFILFLICVVLAAILCVILYRIFIVSLIYQEPNLPIYLRNNARLITTITAACLSVIAITLLNKMYEKIAIFLTEMETWKYQSEWEDAFTFKMYVFQFVNYYGTIIYIAFFKGRINGYPADYDRAFGARGEECDPAGCLVELAIQLGIVMVGKQALNNFKEVIIPLLVGCIKRRKGKKKIETDDDQYTSWERDYDLVDFPIHGLYEEYLEMVIQYGFVTLFVSCFPLAPFFALLNNVIEVRLDAMKMVTQWKRPMAERAQDIGTWFTILVAISKLAVVVNACIIAFTSDFIQRSLFKYTDSGKMADPNITYINWSLSTFRTADFTNKSMPQSQFENETFGDLNRTTHFCRYRDFRYPYDAEDEQYRHTSTYWHVLTAKLAFVLVFEHAVLAIAGLINYLIPDVPLDIKDRTLREKHLAKVALHSKIKTEADEGNEKSY